MHYLLDDFLESVLYIVPKKVEINRETFIVFTIKKNYTTVYSYTIKKWFNEETLGFYSNH